MIAEKRKLFFSFYAQPTAALKSPNVTVVSAVKVSLSVLAVLPAITLSLRKIL